MYVIDDAAIRKIQEYINTPNKKDKHILEDATQEINFRNIPDYNIRLQISKNLQTDSNIVIIDPNINTEEELANRYNSFDKLPHKYKIFSNNYSFQLWGYDVETLYHKILGDIKTASELPDEDNTEVIMANNIIKNEAASSMDRLYRDYIWANDNYLDMTKYNMYKAVEESRLYIETAVPLTIRVPSASPWFTVSDLDKSNINFSYDYNTSYIKEVRSYRDNPDKLLSIGWNPSLTINENSLDMAKRRQEWWLEKYTPRIYDFINEDLPIEDPTNKNDMGMNNIFLVLPDPLPNNPVDLIQCLGISFDSSLKELYYPKLEGNKLISFYRGLPNCKVMVNTVFFDNNLYNTIYNIVTGTTPISDPNIENPLWYIYNNYNIYDPTIDRIAIALCGLFLARLGDKIEIQNNPSCYRVYNGEYNKYSDAADRVEKIVSTIYDKDLRVKYATANFHDYAESCNNKKVLVNAIKRYIGEVCIPRPIARDKHIVHDLNEFDLKLI